MRNQSVTLDGVDVAAAIADPVRREILTRLRDGPLPAGAIASRFAISRPAVSRHLRVLRESGLVVDQPRGRERVYRLDVAPLAELDAWLAQFRGGTWGSRLDALETEVHRTRRDRVRARPQLSDTEERTA
jgi:DNA-binding transcriptional ArsR family regulator